jgi:translation elongation factor EF-1beta
MPKEWENKKDKFNVVDVRKLTGNFLPKLLSKAGQIEIGDGMCVIQSFEPIPLYSAMADLGFEHLTEKAAEGEYRVYFCRIEKKEIAFGAYQLIKTLESKDKTREEVMSALTESFGEKNPEVNVMSLSGKST